MSQGGKWLGCSPPAYSGPSLPSSFLTQRHSFWVGDVVRVIDDLDTVKRLQAGHGEWTDDMAPVSAPTLLLAAPWPCP